MTLAKIEQFRGATMGTHYQVQVALANDLERSVIASGIAQAVTRVDTQMSTFKAMSDICRFNRAGVNDWISVPAQMCTVVQAAIELGHRTDGAFDISVFAAVEHWGFGPSARAPVAQLLPLEANDKPGATFRDIEVRLNPPALRKRVPLTIDLSGIAKGFGVDEIARVLRKFGARHYLIEIAGEVLARGKNPDGSPWTIGLELPVPNRAVAYRGLPLDNCAVATSGSYRNYFSHQGVTYGHTIDPATGRPSQSDLLSVSVVMPWCMDADAMATALMVMGRARAVEFVHRAGIAALFLVAADGGFNEITSEWFAAIYQERDQQFEQ